MSATFTERTRARLRAEVLDVATAVLADGGWPSLRMQAVADGVGVSRRTLYNEFGSKSALAQALVARSTERLAGVVASAFDAAPDLASGWHDAALAVLHDADRDPVLRAVLTETSSPDFLPLLTSAGSRAIDYSTEQMTAAALARWPDLAPHHVALVSHATVRLVISHFLRPGHSYEDAAREIAELAVGYLAGTARSRA